jgi:hypothetical protein
MNINIEFIPHAEQRYNTVGDWYLDDKNNLQIRVSNDDSEFISEKSQFLVGLHELIEVYLCFNRGITQKMVDDFDMGVGSYDNIPDGEESGDQPGAPYRKEHRFAMMIEHLMAHELGIEGYGIVR